MTLSDLRSLLTRAHGPAVERLEDRTPEGVARAYLGRMICLQGDACSFPAGIEGRFNQIQRGNHEADLPLDLTDPGTVFAVRVALALALGLDPGPMGVSCAWHPLHIGIAPRNRVGWFLGADRDVYFVAVTDATGDDDEIVDDAVASEPDAVKALVLAVNAVLQALTK